MHENNKIYVQFGEACNKADSLQERLQKKQSNVLKNPFPKTADSDPSILQSKRIKMKKVQNSVSMIPI